MTSAIQRPPVTGAARRSRLVLVVVILILVPLLLYVRVAGFDYAQADDVDLIRENQAFLGDLGNLPQAFSLSYFESAGKPSGQKTYYRPLVVVSFMLDAQIGGPEPYAYHVTNLVIHIAAVLLLFSLLRTLGADVAPACVLALVFAVHPANTQAVCWIPGRNDSLMAVFAMASLIGLAVYLRTLGRWPVWLHVGAFAAALFTKESALALIPLFCLYAGLWAQRLRIYLRSRAILSAYAVILIGWTVLRRAALAGPDGSLSAGEYLMTMARNAPDLLLYSGKVALPINLNVMPGVTASGAALGAISLALGGWIFARELDQPKLLFVAAWFLLLLAPALPVPGLPAYEHRLYFPLMGVIVGFSQLRVWRAPGRRRAGWIAGVVATTAAFSILAAEHAAVFRDRYAFWTSATEGTPHAGVAHVNLGQIYESDGDVDRAADHYRQALAVDPTTPGAHNDLGVVMAKKGDLEKARVYFEQEIAEHPANADAHFNLGIWYKLAGRVDEAVPRWQQAIAVDGYYLPAYRELAAYYAAKGDAAQAGLYTDRLRAIEARGMR